MSLTMDSNSALSGENTIMKIPQKREEFDNWCLQMTAYLDMKDLLEVVKATTQTVNDKNVGMSPSQSSPLDSAFTTTDVESSVSSSSNANILSSTKTSSNEALLQKRKRVYYILLQAASGNIKHTNLIKSVPFGDAAGVWQKLHGAYGVIKSSSNRVLLLDKLRTLTKQKNDSIEDYLSYYSMI